MSDWENLELFPNVRASDPDTSRVAALVDPGGREALLRRVAAVLAAHPAGLTDWELTDLLGEPAMRKPSIAKRRQEVGAVDTKERRFSPLNVPCIVWALPPVEGAA